MRSRFSKFLGIPSVSGSGASANPGAREQSNAADQRPERSSEEQRSQEPAPTQTRRSFFRKRRGFRPPSPSPSPSPSLSPGIQHRNSTTGHSFQPLAIIPTRPHSSCSGTTAAQTLEPSPHCVTTAIQTHDPGSPPPSAVQASFSTPLNVPSIQTSHPPIASQDPTCPSTSAPPLSPNVVIGSSPHSSRVWATTLEIAENKLRENRLPPLDLTTLTSESPEENIRTVVNQLNTLQVVNKEKQWSYTWRGKEVIVMERLGKILEIVDNYSKVVDTAIQSNPQVSALVWAGVRAIIQVRIQYYPPL